MENTEGKELKEKLGAAAKQALEELKAEGLAKEDVEVASTGVERAWICYVNFSDTNDFLLLTNFTFGPDTDFDEEVRRTMRAAFERGEWTD